MKTQIESGRARHAFDTAEQGLKDGGKEFLSSTKKLGMLVKVNGLIPALLFSKEKQFGGLGERVMNWLAAEGSPVSKLMEQHTQLADLTEVDSSTYRLLTAETQRYLAWVKRFAAALAPETDEAKLPQSSNHGR